MGRVEVSYSSHNLHVELGELPVSGHRLREVFGVVKAEKKSVPWRAVRWLCGRAVAVDPLDLDYQLALARNKERPVPDEAPAVPKSPVEDQCALVGKACRVLRDHMRRRFW